MTDGTKGLLTTEKEDVSFPSATNQHQQMMTMIFGASIVQIVRCAALFSFAEHLSASAVSAKDVASAENLDVASTARLLQACASLGLVTRTRTGLYATTPLLQTLSKDSPHSLRDWAITQGGPGHWMPWGALEEAVRTGKAQAVSALGSQLFDYYASASGAAEGTAFMRAMAGASGAVDVSAAEAIIPQGASVIVDVGSAGGSLLRAILMKNPSKHGILFDRPNVIEDAMQVPENLSLGDRMTYAAGSFFESIPAGDIYLLRHILHDWSDEDAVRILKTCRKSAKSGSRVMIIEIVLDERVSAPFASQLDLTMLTVVGGKERTQAEYTSLLAEAGFTLLKQKSLTPLYSLLEASAS